MNDLMAKIQKLESIKRPDPNKVGQGEKVDESILQRFRIFIFGDITKKSFDQFYYYTGSGFKLIMYPFDWDEKITIKTLKELS